VTGLHRRPGAVTGGEDQGHLLGHHRQPVHPRRQPGFLDLGEPLVPVREQVFGLGRQGERPLRLLERGQCRLGRTAKGLTALFDELVALKVNFVSFKDGIDLGTPAGRLIANVLASVAAYETEVRAERITAGKAAKAAKIDAIIKAGGTPPPVNKGGRPKGIPNKVTPTVATMILQMKAERKKVTLIARELNLSRQTVYEVLRRA
jgi:hypothetical protein